MIVFWKCVHQCMWEAQANGRSDRKYENGESKNVVEYEPRGGGMRDESYRKNNTCLGRNIL